MKKFVFPAIFVCLVIANNVNWGVNGIDGDTDPNNLQDTAIKKLSLREKCLKNSQSYDSYETTMVAKSEFEYCIKTLIDVSVLKKEIETAKPPNGDIDMVFKKYCKKLPEFKECFLNFTSTIEVCLDKGEKDGKNFLQGVIEDLLSFVCHDEGIRISIFYSEGGPECLGYKREAISHCLNTSFSKYMPNGGINLNKFEEEDFCKSISNLQVCLVDELEKCDQPTPAQIVGSLFKFIDLCLKH